MKQRIRGPLVGLMFLFLIIADVVFAQGPPINTNTAFVIGLEGTAIRSFGKVVRKSNLFADGEKITDALDREVTVFALPVMVPYEVIPNRLVVIGAIPYLDKEMKLTQDGNRQSRGDSGIGDLKLLGKYQFLQKDMKRSSFRMTFMGGVKLPTGRDDATDATGLLPPPLQLGSGSVDFFGGPIVTYVRDRFGFNAEAIFKKNTEANDYRFGDTTSVNVALGYRFLPWVYETYPSPYSTAYLELLSEFSGKSRKNGKDLEDTGGTVLLLSPGVQYVFSRTLLAEASFQFPIFQELNGIQLGTDFSFNVGMRWLIR
ncbi:MAG: transporter [Candidatus Poribacteria bacterium]|nr:transporter [Candidatus Poribacteria bacterium]